MNVQTIAILIYALVVFVGGYMGYHIAQSFPSLAMGTFFAVVLVACAWSISLGLKYAYLSSLLVVGLLFLFFAYRFFLSIKFFPAGIMSIVSLAVLVYLILSRK